VDWTPALLRWFDAHRRPMPWRDRPTPYRVWISEIMLQQTQVATALPYFQRFMSRFPSLRKLSLATEQDVLKAWEGLGYYTRARNLHRAARCVVREHHGRLPRSAAALRALPGIGPYSAAAIASIAFGEATPCIDGNVIRVFTRFLGIREESRSPKVRRQLDAYLCPFMNHRPGDLNQAMMELGALVCRPTTPACPTCPLRGSCVAYAKGLVEKLPVRRRGPSVPHHDVAAACVRKGNRLLLVKRPSRGLLGGLWGFPAAIRTRGTSLAATAEQAVQELAGLTVVAGQRLGSVSHGYSHFRVTARLFTCDAPKGRLPGDGSACWVSRQDLDRYPLSRVDRKLATLMAI
jgi:A/G-specific adenine glycosylase